jgi:hypothetical protein
MASHARHPGEGVWAYTKNVRDVGPTTSRYSGHLPLHNAAPKLGFLTSTQEKVCLRTNGFTWRLQRCSR